MESSQPQPGARGRLFIALGAAVILAATVVAVVALGGDESAEPAAGAASDECIRAWNADAEATAFGRHNFNFHDYTGALVTYMKEDGEYVPKEEGGACAVIFPAEVLDPEPIAAGQILRDDAWVPFTALQDIPVERIGELQAEAAQGPNTILDTTGRLSAP